MPIPFPSNRNLRNGRRSAEPYGGDKALPTTGKLSAKGNFKDGDIYGQIDYIKENGQAGGTGLTRSGATVDAKLGSIASIKISNDSESSYTNATIIFKNDTLATIPRDEWVKISFTLPTAVFNGGLEYSFNASDPSEITMTTTGDFENMTASDFTVVVE